MGGFPRSSRSYVVLHLRDITIVAMGDDPAFRQQAHSKCLINYAASVNDLRMPPGNRLERLRGARDGQYRIRVSRGWRICFVWKDGDAFEVELAKHYD